MVFSLFRSGKPSLKLLPRQEVELRYETASGEREYAFVRVREVGKKKISMEPSGQRSALRLVPGQPVTVSALVDNTLFSYDASVLDARDKEFDLNPPKEVEDTAVAAASDDTRLQATLPVKYRAMKMPNIQVAETQAVTPQGLFLLTNMPIPPNMDLHLEVTIPASGQEVSFRARTLTSNKPPDARKAITEVEFVEIDEKDKAVLMRSAIYQHYRKKD